jgi:hypothetical protein
LELRTTGSGSSHCRRSERPAFSGGRSTESRVQHEKCLMSLCRKPLGYAITRYGGRSRKSLSAVSKPGPRLAGVSYSRWHGFQDRKLLIVSANRRSGKDMWHLAAQSIQPALQGNPALARWIPNPGALVLGIAVSSAACSKLFTPYNEISATRSSSPAPKHTVSASSSHQELAQGKGMSLDRNSPGCVRCNLLNSDGVVQICSSIFLALDRASCIMTQQMARSTC